MCNCNKNINSCGNISNNISVCITPSCPEDTSLIKSIRKVSLTKSINFFKDNLITEFTDDLKDLKDVEEIEDINEYIVNKKRIFLLIKFDYYTTPQKYLFKNKKDIKNFGKKIDYISEEIETIKEILFKNLSFNNL